MIVHCHCWYSNDVLSTRSALSTLDQAVLHADSLREMIDELNAKYSAAAEQSSSLLSSLTATASVVEQLRARMGKGSGFITAFSSANEHHIQDLDDEEDVEDDLIDASVEGYDRQRQRLLDAIQEVETTQQPLEEKLADCREQVRVLYK